jgi:hypothetical protein
MLHNANRKRATCTASGDGREKGEEKSDGYSVALNINNDEEGRAVMNARWSVLPSRVSDVFAVDSPSRLPSKLPI